MYTTQAERPHLNWSIEYSSESSISVSGSSAGDNQDDENLPSCQTGRLQDESPRLEGAMEPQPSRHISFAHETSYKYPSSSSANSCLSTRMAQSAPEQDWRNYSDEGNCSPCNSTGGSIPSETFKEGYSYLDRDQQQAPMISSRRDFMENQRYYEQERDPFTAGIPRRDKAKPGRYDAAGPGRLAQRKQKAYPAGSSPYQEHQHEIDVYANEPRGPRRPYSPPMGRLPSRFNSSFREDEEYDDNRWPPNFGDISNVRRARASSASPRMTHTEKPAPREPEMTAREEEILRTHYKTKYLEGRGKTSDESSLKGGRDSTEDASSDNQDVNIIYESEFQATEEQAGEGSGSSVSISVTSQLSISTSSAESADSPLVYPFPPGHFISPLRDYSGDSSDYRTPSPGGYQPSSPSQTPDSSWSAIQQQSQAQAEVQSSSSQLSASPWPSPQSDWSSGHSEQWEYPVGLAEPSQDPPVTQSSSSQSSAPEWPSPQSDWSSGFSTKWEYPEDQAKPSQSLPKITVTEPTPEQKPRQRKAPGFRPLAAQSTPASVRGPPGPTPGSLYATPISARSTPGAKSGSCPRSRPSYRRKPSPGPVIPEMDSSPDPPGYDPTWYESTDSNPDRSLEFRQLLEEIKSEVEEELDGQDSSMKSSSQRLEQGEQEEQGSCPCSSPGKSPGKSRGSNRGRHPSPNPIRTPGRSASSSPERSQCSQSARQDASGSSKALLTGSLSEMIAKLKSMMAREKKGGVAYKGMAECLMELEYAYNKANATTSTENSPLSGSDSRRRSPASDSSAGSSTRISLESSSSISISRVQPSPRTSPRRAVDVARQAEAAKQVPKPRPQYAPVRSSLTQRGKYVPPSKRAGNAVNTLSLPCPRPASRSQTTMSACPCPSGKSGRGGVSSGQPEHFILHRSNAPEPSRRADNTFQRAKADYFRMNPDVDGRRPTGLRQFSEQHPKPDIDFDPYAGGPDYSAYFAGDSPPSNSPLLRTRDAERSELRRGNPICDPPRAPARVGTNRGQTRIPAPQFQTTKRQRPTRKGGNTMTYSSETKFNVKMGPKPRPSPDIPQATRRTTQGVAWEVPMTPKARAVPIPPPARRQVRKPEAWDIPITPKCRAVPVPPPQRRGGQAWEVPITPPGRRQEREPALAAASRPSTMSVTKTTKASFVTPARNAVRPGAAEQRQYEPDPCSRFRKLLAKIPVGTKKYADAVELLADCIKRNNNRQAGLPPPTPFSSQWTGRFEAPLSAIMYEGDPDSRIPTPEDAGRAPAHPHTPYTGHVPGVIPRNRCKRLKRPAEKMKVARQLVDQYEEVGRVESLCDLVDELRKLLVG